MVRKIGEIIKNKVVVITIAMIAIVVAFIMSNQRGKNENNVATITDPETLRAMTYEQVTEDDANVEGIDNIKFSAYFLRDLDGDGYAEKLKGTCSKINTSDRAELNKRLLYIDFNVLGDGKFKDGVITINNKNFNWKTTIAADNIVGQSYNGNVNGIVLNNELLGGSQKLFSGAISPDIKDNINNYSQISSVTLTGTYVDDDQNETPVSKTIDLTVDWYGITKTAVNKDNVIQTRDIDTLINEEKVQIKFDAIVTETEEELLLQKQVVAVHVPEFNGYKPTNVYATYDRVEQSYNSELGLLTIENQANVKQDGYIQEKLSRSTQYEIIAEYPLEAYTSMQNGSVSVDIPILGYNYGFNNPNEEFSNPYISQDSNIVTVVYQDIPEDEVIEPPTGYIVPPTPIRTTWKLNVSVGDYVYSSTTGGKNRVSKDSIIDRYNGNIYGDIEDTYTVKWDVTVGLHELMAKIILEEPTESEVKKSDKYLNSDNQYYSLRDYESTIGIKFSNAANILGLNGYIKLYNADTDTLIKTFTKENWNKYYKINIEDLKSIKIETSTPLNDGILTVEQTKKINDEKVVEDFTREEFNKMRYISSYLKGTIEAKYGSTFSTGESILTLTSQNYANYEEAVSMQSISVKPQQITNQETNNVQLKIQTKSQNNYEKKWTNGVFLVEIPEDIIGVDVNGVTSASKNVKIQSYSAYEENGKHYIKIYVNNSSEELYDITIDADISANPLKTTKTETIKLYAYNENCNNYYNNTADIYDVDNDESRQDAIGYATTILTTVAPSGLLTTEYVTNYDEKGSVTIAPNAAEIEKADGARTATINVGLTNNYTGTIRDVSILGRFPYEGNRFILINRDMKSEYTAHVTGPITVPQSQIDNVIVYYSENGIASKDLNDANNGWVTAENVTDWTLIRSYLIDFGNYVFTNESNDVFTYEVTIPGGLGYNSATFSNHAVYYTLDTENGMLPIATEPNRVGIQIVGKYNLQLTKNKFGNDNTLVKGATYRAVTKDINGKDISKIATTNVNGELTLNGLYIGREYILEEITTPEDYVLNEEKIKINTSVDNQGNLIFNVINDEEKGITGNFKETPVVELDQNNNFLVKAKVEDDTKYTLTINKKDENGEALPGVIFKFGEENSTKNYVTNSNGNIVFKSLELGKIYTIQETKADGYYVDQEAKTFSVIRIEENGEKVLKVQSEDETLANAVIEYPDGVAQTQVTFNIQNERIPTYNLQILKVNDAEEGEEVTPLEGAYFRVLCEDTVNQKEYRTDENGIINLEGLYAHVDGKYVTGRYLLQETKAPTGYTNRAEEINFIVNRTYNEQTQSYDLDFSIENQDQLESIKSVTLEDNTLKVIIQDRPLFKLTKVDSETGEVLSNVEFIIYKIEKDGTTDYAKDEYGNYIGTIDEDGDYIVTTDANGVISLPLPNGIYKAVEVTYPEGYQENGESSYFKVGSVQNEDERENKEVVGEITKINYIEDLVEFSNSVNNGVDYADTTVKLMRTLDFESPDSYKSGEVNEELINGGEGFIPIGTNLFPFEGKFDGQLFEIRNLYVKDVEYAGLFGKISNAEIKRLGVTGSVSSSISGRGSGTIYSYAGGIAGYAIDSTISNCYNTSSVSSSCDSYKYTQVSNTYDYSYAGGIAGYVSGGTIRDCYNTGSVSSRCRDEYNYNSHALNNSYAGGIAGYVVDSTISNCYNTSSVSSYSIESDNYAGKVSINSYAGGIAGYVDVSTISNCYNISSVISNSRSSSRGVDAEDSVASYAGGIAGYVYVCTISNCYNTGSINSYSRGYGDRVWNTGYAGGIAGRVSGGTIRNCYNSSSVSSSNFAGVIAGNVRERICKSEM